MAMANENGSRFTEIVGFKRMQYLPRLGKIRLGIKKVSAKSGKEYPTEVDYFVCPPEVQKVYGDKPKQIDIMFPSEDFGQVIPYCYKKYGSNQKLQCKGNGEIAIYFDVETKAQIQKKCPCEFLEQKKCAKRGHLMVILPRVSLGGVYQIDTGSGANINRVLDAMEYWKLMVGRCKCIPLTLERVPEKMSEPDGKMQTHYLFRFSSQVNSDLLNQAIENNRKILSLDFKIEQPKEDGKEDDTPTAVIDEETDWEINDEQIAELDEKIGEFMIDKKTDKKLLSDFKKRTKISRWQDLSETEYWELKKVVGIKEIEFGE